jgi:hypothetical protein
MAERTSLAMGLGPAQVRFGQLRNNGRIARYQLLTVEAPHKTYENSDDQEIDLLPSMNTDITIRWPSETVVIDTK